MKTLLAALVLLAVPAAAKPFDHALPLPDGRILNLWCDGGRGPLVVFDSGWSADSRAWGKVMTSLAGEFRVCAQDRAGAGRSSPGPLPRDGEAIARDLKAALAKGDVPGPYILVGHSLGGLNMRHFARLFPADSAGLVLVDPSPPQLGPAYPGHIARARTCLASARSGPIPADRPELAACNTSPPEKAAARWEARLSELESVPQTSAELLLQEPGSSDKPLVVLTAGRTNPDPAVAAAWAESHKAVAALSTQGEARLIADSGHMMMFDRPEAIVQAVRQVAAAAKGPRR
jgi:pimeloyl-ACP methyl ester carboxylesterase